MAPLASGRNAVPRHQERAPGDGIGRGLLVFDRQHCLPDAVELWFGREAPAAGHRRAVAGHRTNRGSDCRPPRPGRRNSRSWTMSKTEASSSLICSRLTTGGPGSCGLAGVAGQHQAQRPRPGQSEEPSPGRPRELLDAPRDSNRGSKKKSKGLDSSGSRLSTSATRKRTLTPARSALWRARSDGQRAQVESGDLEPLLGEPDGRWLRCRSPVPGRGTAGWQPRRGRRCSSEDGWPALLRYVSPCL